MGPLRRCNNFMKAAALQRTLDTLGQRELRVVDLACGDGPDVGKYARHRAITHVTFADVADKCLDTCKERCQSFDKGKGVPYNASFVKVDLRTDSLKKELDGTADVVVCHYAIHYMFGDDDHIFRFFRTVRRLLKPDGVFLFTAPMDVEARYWPKGGNDLMRVEFVPDSKTSYHFTLRDAVENVLEHVVPKSTVHEEAKRQDMEVLYEAPFQEAYQDHVRHSKQIADIAKRMRATDNMPDDQKRIFDFYGLYVLRKKCRRQ